MSVLAALVGLAASVQATTINGAVDFKDAFTLNGSFGSATAITGFSAVTVSATSGDFSAIPNGTTVDFSSVTPGTPFTFSPSTAYVGLWSIVYGGITYTFDVTSTVVIAHTSSTIALEGDGIMHATGYDDSAGTWNLTLNGNGGLLNFSGGANVPDGGTTVGLLGLALGACGMFARKMKKLV